MDLGTARIYPATQEGRKYFTTQDGRQYVIVRWMNVGNFLDNEPRAFWTEEEARAWCKERALRVVQS